VAVGDSQYGEDTEEGLWLWVTQRQSKDNPQGLQPRGNTRCGRHSPSGWQLADKSCQSRGISEGTVAHEESQARAKRSKGQ